MKVGDLVEFSHIWSPEKTQYHLGVVTEIEKDFFPHMFTGECTDRITVLWTSGNATREPANRLKILKES
jgi:hypothetical protein